MNFYIDIFFFINFLFDFLVLLISGRLGGVRIRFLKILFASLAGGILACTALFIPFCNNFFMKTAVITLMSFISYGYGCLFDFTKQTLILFLGFFLCGGAADAVLLYGTERFDGLKAHSVLMVIVICLILIFITSGKIHAAKCKTYVRLCIGKDGMEYNFNGLFDTGNLCTDFQSGLPVILAENVFGEIRGREEFYKTASGFGIMKVFLPDYIFLETKDSVYEGKDVAIGVVNERLSPDGSFNALIGGICFEHLVGKNKKAYKNAFFRKGNILHRDVGSASAPFKH